MPRIATNIEINQLMRAEIAKDKRPSHEIGAVIGIHDGSVRRWKSGKKNLTFENLQKLARVLGLKLEITLTRARKEPAAA